MSCSCSKSACATAKLGMPLGGKSPLGPAPFAVVGHGVMVIGAPWLSTAGTGGQPTGVLNPVGASGTDWLINRANAPNARASVCVVKIRLKRKWRFIVLLLSLSFQLFELGFFSWRLIDCSDQNGDGIFFHEPSEAFVEEDRLRSRQAGDWPPGTGGTTAHSGVRRVRVSDWERNLRPLAFHGPRHRCQYHCKAQQQTQRNSAFHGLQCDLHM